MSIKRKIAMTLVLAMMVTGVCGCSSKNDNVGKNSASAPIAADVKKEGTVVTYGMPPDWANYKSIYKSFTNQYGITFSDTDISSSEEISKFVAEKNHPVADLGELGQTYADTAIAKKIPMAYKNKYWDNVPEWAKNKDGYWCGAYYGSICFMVNKKLVKDTPHTWKDLLKPEYKSMVVVGNVQQSAQAQTAFLAATYASGGSESNLQPGIDYFKKLKAAGNIKIIDDTIANIQKGEIPIVIWFDFNALSTKHMLKGQSDFDVVIPSDGSASCIYVSVINANAPHPAAAKALQDYIFSDAGQIQYAEGYARPIRTDIKLPDNVKAMLLPDSEYKSVKHVENMSDWIKNSKELPDLWRNNILAQ